MEPSTLNMLCHTVLLTLTLALTCNAGRSLDVDETLQQILSENNDETYYPSDSTDLDTSDRALSDLFRRLKPGSNEINKRVFCNGFRGCRGRGRKRTMPMKQQMILPEEPPVQKRPFCNGFFGCANGKRSSIGVPSRQQIPDQNELETVELPKRLFCNPYGCLNGKRSSLYNTLISKLRTNQLNLEQADSDLPIRINNDPMALSKSLRQILAAEESDVDGSYVSLEPSELEPDVRQNTPQWCKNCNLVKFIMPQLYEYRNKEAMLSKLNTEPVSAGEMSREPMTSDILGEVHSKDLLLPEETRQHVDNIKIDKKCNPMSRRRSSCNG